LSLHGGKELDYKVRNGNGEYFVDWVGQLPVFNSNIIMGKRLTETEAKNLIEILAEENLGLCEMIQVDVI
jgi:hypothetical protein